MSDTKAGRDPEGAVKQIEAQAQARGTCPWCGGAKVLSGPVEGFSGAALHVATIYCPKCEGEGTVPAGQGDLETALLKASALKYDSQQQTQKPCEMHPEGERWCFEDRHIGDINWHCWPCLIDHLAAMPPSPAGRREAQSDAVMLGALRNAQEVIHLQFCKADKECWKECREASAAIAQTEQGAAERAPCAKCGGLPAEHRYRMGDGPWCACGDGGCECDGYVAEQGAAG